MLFAFCHYSIGNFHAKKLSTSAKQNSYKSFNQPINSQKLPFHISDEIIHFITKPYQVPSDKTILSCLFLQKIQGPLKRALFNRENNRTWLERNFSDGFIVSITNLYTEMAIVRLTYWLIYINTQQKTLNLETFFSF